MIRHIAVAVQRFASTLWHIGYYCIHVNVQHSRFSEFDIRLIWANQEIIFYEITITIK
jgi:hypothetical protein